MHKGLLMGKTEKIKHMLLEKSPTLNTSILIELAEECGISYIRVQRFINKCRAQGKNSSYILYHLICAIVQIYYLCHT